MGLAGWGDRELDATGRIRRIRKDSSTAQNPAGA